MRSSGTEIATTKNFFKDAAAERRRPLAQHLIVTNLAIGMVTPPVGVNLFVGCTLADVKIEKIAKAVVVPLCAMLGILMLVTYIPAVSTWLPAFVQ